MNFLATRLLGYLGRSVLFGLSSVFVLIVLQYFAAQCTTGLAFEKSMC